MAATHLLAWKCFAILFVVLPNVDEAHFLELRHANTSLVGELYLVNRSNRTWIVVQPTSQKGLPSSSFPSGALADVVFLLFLDTEICGSSSSEFSTMLALRFLEFDMLTGSAGEA